MNEGVHVHALLQTKNNGVLRHLTLVNRITLAVRQRSLPCTYVREWHCGSSGCRNRSEAFRGFVEREPPPLALRTGLLLAFKQCTHVMQRTIIRGPSLNPFSDPFGRYLSV